MQPEKNQEFSYHVEVSGWDHEHNFFVEKVSMELLAGEASSLLFQCSQ
jgi:hypothetical protein